MYNVVHTQIHTHIHTHLHTHIHTHIHVHIHVYILKYIHTQLPTVLLGSRNQLHLWGFIHEPCGSDDLWNVTLLIDLGLLGGGKEWNIPQAEVPELSRKAFRSEILEGFVPFLRRIGNNLCRLIKICNANYLKLFSFYNFSSVLSVFVDIYIIWENHSKRYPWMQAFAL